MARDHHLDSLFESMLDDIKYIKRTTYFMGKYK